MFSTIITAPDPRKPLRPKLDRVAPLLKAVVREVAVGPRQNVLQQGAVPRIAHLLVKGMAFRSRLLDDGRRQITAILIPGDVCDLDAVMRGRADYSIELLTSCVLGEIPADHLRDPDGADPEVRQVLWRQLLRDEAIAREWMVGFGRRNAVERTAHLLCELWERLREVGLVEDDAYDLDLTQTELGDVLGLSTVHVNRILQELRRERLIEFSRKVMRVTDRAALMKVAMFDPTYLDHA